MTASMPPPILVLGRDTCEDTVRSRAWMDAKGVAYAYRNVEEDPDADAMNRSFNDGMRVTPVILVGDPERPSRVLKEPSDDELERAITEASSGG